SQWEGIALTIFEAMACGLAVVASDVGGQRELLTPETGVLIPRGSEEQEIDQYSTVLLSLINDQRRRESIGENARRRVTTNFHSDQMGDRLKELISTAGCLRREQPRPSVGIGVGRLCASQAVEYSRLFSLAENLWAERRVGGANNADLPFSAQALPPASAR